MDTLPLVTVALLGAYDSTPRWAGCSRSASGCRIASGGRCSAPPIALGHEAAIALVAALVIGFGVLADPRPLHLVAAAALIGFGLFRFWKPRAHPRWTTMRVTRGELPGGRS